MGEGGQRGREVEVERGGEGATMGHENSSAFLAIILPFLHYRERQTTLQIMKNTISSQPTG